MEHAQRKSKLFFWVMFLASAYLIVRFPEHTSELKRARGWYTQPFVAPLVGLSVLAFFAMLKLVLVGRRLADEPGMFKALLENLPYYLVVLITGGLFLAYLYLLGIIGFALSTLLFVLALLWLSRLMTIFWVVNAVVAVAFLVLVFRVGVNIWFPDVALYEALFSGKVLWFMNSYM